MSELFAENRNQFLKIFETHQFKGLISFTDILKICSSLKIFPDLLDSQGIQKAFASVSNGNFQKISYLEFEKFLQLVALKIFRATDENDFIEIFLAHIKKFALKSYGVDVKTLLRIRRSQTKKYKKVFNLNTSKNKSAGKFQMPIKTINNKKKNIELSSPLMIQFRKRKCESLTDINLTDSQLEVEKESFRTSRKNRFRLIEKSILKLEKSMKEIRGKKYLAKRKLQKCCRISAISNGNFIVLKLVFQIWRMLW